MILSNVNIGTGPSAGDGDPLRTAFNTINQNFTLIQSNVNSLTNSVSSVAGRTGNVTLTTQDIVGISNYATTLYVATQLANVSGSYSNTNVAAYLPGYSGTIATVTTANTAMKAYVDSKIQANIVALIDSAPGALDTLNELAAALNDDASFASNVLADLASLTANAGAQASSITTLQGNITTLTANAGAQASSITALEANVSNLQTSNYSNSNVASYLTTYSGNVSVGNVIFDDLSIQTTAYTGTQWRSNIASTLTSKPSWLSYVPGGKNQEGTQYGFDSGGMFFTSNADNDFAYPIQTTLHFHEQDTIEVVATINYTATNNDQGLCVFSANTRPVWKAGTDPSRIAFQYSSGIPVLYGQTTANTSPGTSILTPGNYYTIKFTYDPDDSLVTVNTFSGNTATGSPIDTRIISENLSIGDYKLGFDADNDAVGVKSYFTNLIVRTLTDTVVNDLEVQGYVTGNLTPVANVTYDLGSNTNRWKDLWLSGSTINIGNASLSVANGAIQSSLPIAANVTATNITVQGTRIEFASGGYIEETEVIDGNATPLGYYGVSLNSSDDGIIGMNALDSNAAVTSSVFVTNVSVQLNVANSISGGPQHTWYFDNSGALTFPDGTSQNTAGGYGNVDVKTYLENYDGDINFSSGHKITQQLNRDFQIRVSDDEDDGWALQSIVDNGTGTDLTRTSVEYDGFYINTDLPGGNHGWSFQDNGQMYVPGAINGPTGSNFAIRIGGQLYAAPSYIDIETRSPVGDALISQIRVGDPNVTISTASTAHKWIFEDTNKLVIPQHSVITTANANGGLGGNTISIIGGASDADTWNGNPGGNVDIQGGYGSFADGGGGNGGDVNIRGGGSAEAQKGRVIISSGTNNWVFANTGTVTVPGEGVIQSLDDSVTLVSLNTTSGYANSVYLGTSGGLGFFDQSAGGNWLEIFRTGTAPDIKATTSNLLITTVIPGISSNTWTFGQNGSITFPDNTVQTTAWTGSGGYSNVQVATYLPTYTGNIGAGNLAMTDNVSSITFPVGSYIQGNTSISNRGGSIVLQPNTAASSFAGVIIGGAGRILSPNGFVNIINGDSAVTLQAPTTVSSATASTNSTTGALIVTGGVGIGGNLNIGSGNLTVTNNTTTGNLSTAGSILSSGVNGKIGYSAGGYVVQSGNSSGVSLNTISGNIQLDTVNIAVNTTHTVALTNNKLDANDIILVQGQDTNAIDLHIGAYYLTTNTALIYLRNISGSSIGPIAPTLKFIIVKAPSA